MVVISVMKVKRWNMSNKPINLPKYSNDTTFNEEERFLNLSQVTMVKYEVFNNKSFGML